MSVMSNTRGFTNIGANDTCKDTNNERSTNTTIRPGDSLSTYTCNGRTSKPPERLGYVTW